MHLYLYIIQWMVSVHHLSFSLLPLTLAVHSCSFALFLYFLVSNVLSKGSNPGFHFFLNIFFFVAYAIDF